MTDQRAIDIHKATVSHREDHFQFDNQLSDVLSEIRAETHDGEPVHSGTDAQPQRDRFSEFKNDTGPAIGHPTPT